MAIAVLNGTNFYYEVSGKGQPLVLISGLSCGSSHWAAVLESFNRNFMVIRIDNRGAGRTQFSDSSFSVDEMAADVVALLKYLNIGKAHILGHSMGGAIAQTIAYRYPGVVDKLVISNSFVKIKTRSLLFMNNLASMYLRGVPAEETIPINAPWVFSDQFLSQENIIENLITFDQINPYPQPAIQFAHQVAAIAGFNSSEWLSGITAATLIIAGKADYLTPLNDSEYMHKKIPGSEFVVQEGAHVPMIEIPAEFSQLVDNFLR